jgi:lipopolysaccharide/colanic/teichoic acid biosynthesis glycosyltransferase
MMKRALDVSAALFGLLLLVPLFPLVAFAITLDSRGPVFFRQQRIGRGFRPFTMYKFRTMRADAPAKGGLLTATGDARITPVGAFLRWSKIDELPQLINVLRGDMSLVGPRPEVPKYVELFRPQYERILAVRPGITDFASIKYRDESSLLAKAANPEQEYVTRILPDKLRLAEEYVRRSSVALDLQLIVQTVTTVLKPDRRPPASQTS